MMCLQAKIRRYRSSSTSRESASNDAIAPISSNEVGDVSVDESGSRKAKAVPHLLIIRPLPLKQNDGILAWIFPAHISQSRYAGRSTASNACTLIALHAAELIQRCDIAAPHKDANNNWVVPSQRKEAESEEDTNARKLLLAAPEDLVRVLTNSIINGNATHRAVLKRRHSDAKKAKLDTFTVPLGIQHLERLHGVTMHEIDFINVTGTFLPTFPALITAAINSTHIAHLPRLFFIVISVQRAVLLSFERKQQTLLLIDSHSHKQGQQGAIMAAVHVDQIEMLTKWIGRVIYPENNEAVKDVLYEVSCLQLIGPPQSTDAKGIVFSEKISQRLFTTKAHNVLAKGLLLQTRWKKRKARKSKSKTEDCVITAAAGTKSSEPSSKRRSKKRPRKA